MIGTTCLGGDYHYTGCEPFTKTFQGLEKMVKDMNLKGQYLTKDSIIMTN